MRLTRLFYPYTSPQAGQLHTLSEGASRHLLQVLRAKPGQHIHLFNGTGQEWLAQLSPASRRTATVELLAPAPALPSPRIHITLAQGIARGERMDFIVQKAVELGVSQIVPLLTEHCGVHYPDSQRAQQRQHHWREVAISACEQSGRADLPEISCPQPVAQWLATQTKGLVMQPGATTTLKVLPPPLPDASIQLLVGPEGGFSPVELALAQTRGFTLFRLGSRILRTETAGLAALTALQLLWGDLGE